MTEDDRIQAGELALGVLDGDERAVALRRVLAEPAFAAEVARWRRHLAALIDAFPDAVAPDAVERRVLARVAPARSTGGGWRALAGAATAIAATLALVVAWPHRPPTAVRAPAPARAAARLLVATLAGEGAKPLAAVYDLDAGRVAVIGALSAPADRSAELWVIAPGKPPSPLGLLGAGDRSAMTVASDRRRAMAAGATLAVSIEPRGGSPTGLPTGPVVASGGLMAG